MITYKIVKGSNFDPTDNSIKIIRGNNIQLELSILDENDTLITLGENDYILFYVKARNGKEYLKSVFTSEDYNLDGYINIDVKPQETLKLFVNSTSFVYGITYIKDSDQFADTIIKGKLIVEEDCGTVNDISE